jgi:hypothetical protein
LETLWYVHVSKPLGNIYGLFCQKRKCQDARK